MARFSKEQWIGVLLILAALFIWVPLDFIPYKSQIAAAIVVLIGLWKIFIR